MLFRYNLYFWTPPKLTPEQEIEIGRQIVVVGRDAFLQRTPYLSERESKHVEAGKQLTRRQRIILAVVGVPLMIAALAALPLVILLGAGAVVIYSGSTLLHSRSLYRRWVDDMIAKYAASVAQGSNHESKIR
jgi:hypothetical protein